MNRNRAAIFAAIMATGFWTAPCYAAADPAFPPEVEKIFAQPEEKIDFGRAALTLDKLTYSTIDVDAFSSRIDDLAQQVKQITKGRTDPDLAAQALNTVLYERAGFHYDFTPRQRLPESDFFLTGLLQTRQGICEPLTELYLAVAQRAGFRVYPVRTPGHVFVRILGPGDEVQDVDPSSGTLTSDAYYIARLHIGAQGIKSGLYMKTITFREMLAAVLLNDALILHPTDDPAKEALSIAYMQKAAELDPLNAEVIENQRVGYEYERMRAAIRRDMTAAAEIQKKADAAYAKTEQLGYVAGEEQQ